MEPYIIGEKGTSFISNDTIYLTFSILLCFVLVCVFNYCPLNNTLSFPCPLCVCVCVFQLLPPPKLTSLFSLPLTCPVN